MSPVQRGELRQVAPAGPTLRFQFNPDSVRDSGGIGGWIDVERPRKAAVLEWTGLPVRRLQFTLVFDRAEAERSVEPELARLERMARPTGPGEHPPLLQLSYGPVADRAARFVIESLEYGAEQRGPQLGRVMAEVTVSLLQYREATVALTPTDRHRGEEGGGNGKGSGRSTRVRAGESLGHVAARELGDAARWQDIAALNGIRDPRRLQAGQELKLP